MPEGNGFYRFVCKRKSFEHEWELLAMLQDLPSQPHATEPAARSFDYISNLLGGRLIPVALPDLLEAVYVAPTSQPWFLQLVKGLTTKYGLALPVMHRAWTMIRNSNDLNGRRLGLETESTKNETGGDGPKLSWSQSVTPVNTDCNRPDQQVV